MNMIFQRYQPTYEELKQRWDVEPWDDDWVTSLPMRNWNFPPKITLFTSLFRYQPTYEELKLK